MASEMQLPTPAQNGSVDVRAPGLFMSLVKIISSCKTVRDYLMNPEIEKARGKAGTYPTFPVKFKIFFKGFFTLPKYALARKK